MCHLPEDLVSRLLTAAHSAPSAGLMQLSRFIVIRDPAVRSDVYGVFERANVQAASSYGGGRREQYADLKLEGMEAPQNLCVLCDSGSGRGHGLGRQTMPETALYSTVCAIQNLWLAARSEGVGMGWVSILDSEKLREVPHIPAHLTLVAYLCLGYVNGFDSEPDLERHGWERHVPVDLPVPTIENQILTKIQQSSYRATSVVTCCEPLSLQTWLAA
jgi:5,6-dimethylbenzimidazole synthase